MYFSAISSAANIAAVMNMNNFNMQNDSRNIHIKNQSITQQKKIDYDSSKSSEYILAETTKTKNNDIEKYEKLLDYLLLAQSCNDLICPLDLFDPVTWEFKKEECPFNKSCFDITIVDWHNGLDTSIGSIGCFMYGENLLFKKNSPIKKIIKKLKYNERNINIFNEHY